MDMWVGLFAQQFYPGGGCETASGRGSAFAEASADKQAPPLRVAGWRRGLRAPAAEWFRGAELELGVPGVYAPRRK